MTASPALPKRRRRLVAVLLLLISIAGWWCWPRGDARFVGKWAVEPVTGPNGYAAVCFLRTGYVEMSNVVAGRHPDRPSQRLRWWTRGNELIFRPPRESHIDDLKDSVLSTILRIQGQPSPFDIVFTIQRADAGRLELRARNNSVVVYTRLPE